MLMDAACSRACVCFVLFGTGRCHLFCVSSCVLFVLDLPVSFFWLHVFELCAFDIVVCLGCVFVCIL